MSDFGDYLRSLRCEQMNAERTAVCGARADHRQAGMLVCYAHLDTSPRAPRAFATND